MSKDSFEKTEENSFRYSGIGGEVASELDLNASASHCEMVEDALMSIEEGEGNRPVAYIQSPSSIDSGTSSEVSSSEE